MENNNALYLAVLPEPGSYVIFVTSANEQSNGIGNYALLLRKDVIQAVAYGADLANASINNTDLQTSAGTYLDAYWFAAAANDRVDITMNSTVFNSFLSLQANSGGHPLASDDNSGGGTNARLQRQLAVGIYIILATPYEPNRTGSYMFSLNRLVGFGASTEEAPSVSVRPTIRSLEARGIEP